MSQKDVSQSIIEGGRAKRNKESRRDSNQQHRAQNRHFSKKTQSLVDADDAGVTPVRKQVGKDFDDKFGAARRWLASKVGKPWNDIYSEICRRFDSKSLGGRHALEHLMNWVGIPGELYYMSSQFFVDGDGILRKNFEKRRRYPREYTTEREISKWVKGRRVMDYGDGSIFWMVPEKLEWQKCGYTNHGRWWGGSCWRDHKDSTELVKVETKSVLAFEKSQLHCKMVDGEKVYYRERPIKMCLRGTGTYRQGPRLGAKDLEFWNKLSQSYKDFLLWVLPKETRKKLPYKGDKRYSDFARNYY